MQKMLEPSLGVNIMLDQYYVVWEKKSNNIIKTDSKKEKKKRTNILSHLMNAYQIRLFF